MFFKFIKLNGGIFKFLTLVLFAVIGIFFSKTLASIYIQYWCENPEETQYVLYIFVGLKFIAIGFLFIAAYTCSVRAAINHGRKTHKEIIKRLLYASLGNFFNRIPTGRIVNRLTEDLRTCDEGINYAFLWFLTNSFELMGSIAICAFTTTPLVIIPAVIVGYLANRLRIYYLKTTR